MNKLKNNEKKAKKYLEKYGLIKYLQGGTENQLKPDYCDLARLHSLVIERKPFVILEFGVGWSTIILADALRTNGQGKIFSVDSSEYWIGVTDKLIPPELKEYVEFCYSEVKAGQFNERMCHFFKSLPDIVPDFIYLDGPDPSTVQGNINGLSWKNRTVMAGDILLIEPTFPSRTFIIVDGRTPNVRFLANNLQRRWVINCNESANVSTLELAETPRLVMTKKLGLSNRILKKGFKKLKKVKSFKGFKDLIRTSIRYMKIRI